MNPLSRGGGLSQIIEQSNWINLMFCLACKVRSPFRPEAGSTPCQRRNSFPSSCLQCYCDVFVCSCCLMCFWTHMYLDTIVMMWARYDYYSILITPQLREYKLFVHGRLVAWNDNGTCRCCVSAGLCSYPLGHGGVCLPVGSGSPLAGPGRRWKLLLSLQLEGERVPWKVSWWFCPVEAWMFKP